MKAKLEINNIVKVHNGALLYIVRQFGDDNNVLVNQLTLSGKLVSCGWVRIADCKRIGTIQA